MPPLPHTYKFPTFLGAMDADVLALRFRRIRVCNRYANFNLVGAAQTFVAILQFIAKPTLSDTVAAPR